MLVQTVQLLTRNLWLASELSTHFHCWFLLVLRWFFSLFPVKCPLFLIFCLSVSLGGGYNPLLSRFPFLLLSAQLFYFLFSSKETVPYFYLSLNSSNDQYVLNLVVVFFKICTVTMHKSHLKTQFIVYYFRTVKQPAEDFRGWWNRYVNPVTLTWYWSAGLMTTSISETLCKNMEDGIYILQTFSMNYCYLYSLEENNREKKKTECLANITATNKISPQIPATKENISKIFAASERALLWEGLSSPNKSYGILPIAII